MKLLVTRREISLGGKFCHFPKRRNFPRKILPSRYFPPSCTKFGELLKFFWGGYACVGLADICAADAYMCRAGRDRDCQPPPINSLPFFCSARLTPPPPARATPKSQNLTETTTAVALTRGGHL